MHKLLHVHSNIVFIDHSRRYVTPEIHNEVLFIGIDNESNRLKLHQYGIKFKIFENTPTGISDAINYANSFDGVIFHCLYQSSVQILFNLNPKIKTFLKFFGQELYMLSPETFLSSMTNAYQPKSNYSILGRFKRLLSGFKRKVKIAINKEYFVQRDNQKRVYERFDVVLMISKFEYDELAKLFYLPKLIERQLVDQEQEIYECKLSPNKLNKIIIGNSGHRWNNHLDILNMISSTHNAVDIEFNLFFSYGTESIYSEEVKLQALKIKNLNLIESFLSKDKFEEFYFSAAALVINSYRQHAIGNIFAGIKNGCKIYLNKKSSTYDWLLSKGFLISEVEELKNDIETNNIKLSVEQQQYNFDCFINAVKSYTIEDFIDNVIKELKN